MESNGEEGRGRVRGSTLHEARCRVDDSALERQKSTVSTHQGERMEAKGDLLPSIPARSSGAQMPKM
jgi:hypothetical protein